MNLKSRILFTLATVGLSGCHSVDIKNNVVYGRVYIPFANVGEWETYGVGGALQSRRFIRWDMLPENYPYQEYCFTGFGGVLLVCTINNDYVAYDLACPVEHSQSVLVAVDTERNYAVCPKCGSTYDVFQLEESPGYPLSGRARDSGYGLTSYRVAFGVDGRYALITQ